MKKMILGAFAAFTLVACGGGDPCSATSKCSADPKSTSEQITACQALIKDGAKCATELKATFTCSQANQVCGTDNKTDSAATGAKCTTENAAYVACLLK